jgi:hypothetical protein
MIDHRDSDRIYLFQLEIKLIIDTAWSTPCLGLVLGLLISVGWDFKVSVQITFSCYHRHICLWCYWSYSRQWNRPDLAVIMCFEMKPSLFYPLLDTTFLPLTLLMNRDAMFISCRCRGRSRRKRGQLFITDHIPGSETDLTLPWSCASKWFLLLLSEYKYLKKMMLWIYTTFLPLTLLMNRDAMFISCRCRGRSRRKRGQLFIFCLPHSLWFLPWPLCCSSF